MRQEVNAKKASFEIKDKKCKRERDVQSHQRNVRGIDLTMQNASDHVNAWQELACVGAAGLMLTVLSI